MMRVINWLASLDLRLSPHGVRGPGKVIGGLRNANDPQLILRAGG